jgi:hypothetical protein
MDPTQTRLAADLRALDESFGVLVDEEIIIRRGSDERRRHLEGVARAADCRGET